MTEKELKAKTKNIALSVANLCQKLPVNRVNNTNISQILRSSASMGANYRAACRAKSTRDFIYKLQVVAEETDATLSERQLSEQITPVKEIEDISNEKDHMSPSADEQRLVHNKQM